MQEQSSAHALETDGVFLPSGTFRVLSPLPEDTLCEALHHKVLNILRDEGALATDLAHRIRQWRHLGISVHNRIRSKAADAEGRQRLAQYMIRRPFALNKMSYDRKSGIGHLSLQTARHAKAQLPAHAGIKV